MRNGIFNCAANVAQVIRQMIRVQCRLDGHHPTTNIDPDSSRDDGAFGWNDAAHSRADPPMYIGHRGAPVLDVRHSREFRSCCFASSSSLTPFVQALMGAPLSTSIRLYFVMAMVEISLYFAGVIYSAV